MKKYFIVIVLNVIMCACSSNTNSNEASENESVVSTDSSDKEDVYSDVENCFKQWNADNPNRPDVEYNQVDAEPGPAAIKAHKAYVKNNFGKDHSRTAIVKMYDKCPIFYDGSAVTDDDVSSMKIYTGDYIVYSVWRGPVVAQNKKTGYWFVVWDEDYHYNTKYIESEGDGLIKMEYIDVSDIDDNTNVIHYNLDNHKYYFAKEKRTESDFGN